MTNRLILFLPLTVLAVGFGLISCVGSSPDSGRRSVKVSSKSTAEWLRDCPRITWLPRQVSGRYDGASALDNIRQASAGLPAKRSSYGTAPGGSVRLNPQMLRAMKVLVKEGYSFRVTSIAGASHSRTSRHYTGVAFDIDMINGVKVGYGSAHWKTFLSRCREMGATELLGPGDKGHSSHIHAAWPRPAGM